MPETPPPLSLDDDMLNHIEWALDPSQHDDGRTHMHELLDFLSGYDPSRSVLIGEGDPMGLGVEAAPIYEYPDPTYHEHDLIRTLVDEVRRLRNVSQPPREFHVDWPTSGGDTL